MCFILKMMHVTFIVLLRYKQNFWYIAVCNNIFSCVNISNINNLRWPWIGATFGHFFLLALTFPLLKNIMDDFLMSKLSCKQLMWNNQNKLYGFKEAINWCHYVCHIQFIKLTKLHLKVTCLAFIKVYNSAFYIEMLHTTFIVLLWVHRNFDTL